MTAGERNRIDEQSAREQDLPSRVFAVCVTWPVPLVMGLYIGWVGAASPLESACWVMAFTVALIGAVASTPVPDFRFLLRGAATRLEGARRTESGRAERVLQELVTLPVTRERRIFVAMSSAGAFLLLVLGLVGDGHWFAWPQLKSVLLATLVCAAISGNVLFHWTRRTLAPSRAALVAAVPSAASVEAGPALGSFATRLMMLVVLPAVAGMLLVLDAAERAEVERVEARAMVWMESALEALATPSSSWTSPSPFEAIDRPPEEDSEFGADAALPLDRRLAERLSDRSLWPVSAQIFEIESKARMPDALSESSRPFLAELQHGIARGARAGRVQPTRGRTMGAFRRDARDSLIVARINRDALLAGVGTGAAPVLVLIGMAAISMIFARLLVLDWSRSMDGLLDRADHLAAGEPCVESVSGELVEFQEMGRALSRAATALRGMREGDAKAAERVERSVDLLRVELESIAAARIDQADRIDQANRLLAGIERQVEAVSDSAERLTSAIDASSNSVLELGAGGDELDETALVLTAKVDAVSGSLEQMVASVKQVGSTTDRLAEASEETSSSMEEMASAMRAVDTAAETTAKISRDVVEKAELGQTKVVQTIVGMDAIREATETAERVIRGLGTRTKEIGGILDVIEDVADETNLLALNAAIIAAQAGEQGKAFSVVADEIKELADRVLASTKEIGGLIRAVQEESENAIGAIEVGATSVMDGVDLSAEAGRTLEEITVASRESGTRISEIVNSVREQTKAASHVVLLMERVRESAEQISEAGVHQDRGNEVVYRSALTMREVAQQLRQTTQDQAAGFDRIRQSVVGVRSSVDEITDVLREQSTSCLQVKEYLEGAAACSRASEEAAARVHAAMDELAGRAKRLRESASGRTSA